MATANKKTAEKWVKMARDQAARQMGSSRGLLTAEVQLALECAKLVGIIAGQDESVMNGATMSLACEMINFVTEKGN